jgi:hypothetical protein
MAVGPVLYRAPRPRRHRRWRTTTLVLVLLLATATTVAVRAWTTPRRPAVLWHAAPTRWASPTPTATASRCSLRTSPTPILSCWRRATAPTPTWRTASAPPRPWGLATCPSSILAPTTPG